MSLSNPIPTDNRKATLFAVAAVVLWSTVATGFKLGLEQFSVLQLLWLGTLCSWLVFAVHFFVTRKPGDLPTRSSSRLIAVCLLLGVFNPVIYYQILFAAYDLLPAFVAQPLNYTWAITLSLLSVPLLGHAFTKRNLAGLLCSYAGVVVLIVGAANSLPGQISQTGVALALVSTVIWAGYWLMSTRWANLSPHLMFYSYTVAVVVLSIQVAWQDAWVTWTVDALIYGAWVGCIEMGFTFLLWQRAMLLTDNAARIGQLIFLSPFLSFALVWWVLDEPVGVVAVLALALIVAGTVIAQRQSSPTTG